MDLSFLVGFVTTLKLSCCIGIDNGTLGLSISTAADRGSSIFTVAMWDFLDLTEAYFKLCKTSTMGILYQTT